MFGGESANELDGNVYINYKAVTIISSKVCTAGNDGVDRGEVLMPGGIVIE